MTTVLNLLLSIKSIIGAYVIVAAKAIITTYYRYYIIILYKSTLRFMTSDNKYCKELANCYELTKKICID